MLDYSRLILGYAARYGSLTWVLLQLVRRRLNEKCGRRRGGLAARRLKKTGLGEGLHPWRRSRRPSGRNELPELYGWTPMSPNRKTKVRYETLLVIRAAELFSIFCKLDRPWIIENPVVGTPDMFRMPELLDLLRSYQGIFCTKFSHCPDTLHQAGVTRNKSSQPAVHFTTKLRGNQLNTKEQKAQEDKLALAGVRNSAEAVNRLPGHLELG